MLGHCAGIGYTGPGPRMGPIDNFSLVTGSISRNIYIFFFRVHIVRYNINFCIISKTQ